MELEKYVVAEIEGKLHAIRIIDKRTRWDVEYYHINKLENFEGKALGHASIFRNDDSTYSWQPQDNDTKNSYEKWHSILFDQLT